MSKFIRLFPSAVALLFGSSTLIAGPIEQAERMHQRLACTSPSAEIWNEMTAFIEAGDPHKAAIVATTQKGFYNCFLQRFFSPFASQERVPYKPLDDFIATGIGVVKDDLPFQNLLDKDIIYTANTEKYTLPAYSVSDNSHYQELEKLDLAYSEVLEQKQQTELTGFEDHGGVLSTRGFAQAYMDEGTNRLGVFRAIEMFTCRTREKMKDPTLPRNRIGRDIPRLDKGNASDFINECGSCHAGVDAARGAFAHFDYVGEALVYTAEKVRPKYHRGSDTFPDGFAQSDDSWVNYWVEGKNKDLGFPEKTKKGNGLASFAKMLSEASSLSTCMAQRALESVCQIDFAEESVKTEYKAHIDFLASEFSGPAQGRMRYLFALSAVLCKGE